MRLDRFIRTTAALAAGLVVVGLAGASPALAAKPVKTPVKITSGPQSLTRETTASFVWSGPSGATYQCSRDGSAYAACPTGSPMYSGLSDGQHTFTVRTKPPRPVSDTWTWTVDTTAPAAPTITQVASPTRTTSANVYFSDTDASAVSHLCTLDTGSPVACTSPFPVSGLADGVHTVYVQSADAIGNVSAPAQMSWTVDSTAPMSVVVTLPSTLTNLPTMNVQFSADGATSYSCSLDSAAFSDCVSPLALTGLAEGVHSITVTASDAVGNLSLPGTAVWTVDMTPPATPTIMTGPPTNTDQALVDFVLGNVDSSGTLYCVLDGTTAACPSPLTLNAASYGAHHLDIYSKDEAGNSSGTASWDWSRTSGVVSPAHITTGPASPSNLTAPAITFLPTGNNAAGYWCSLTRDGVSQGPAVDCDSGAWPFALLTDDGAYVFSVVVEDTNANKSDAVSWSWTADFTKPVAPVFSTSPASSTTDTTAVFSFAQEAGTSYTCALDGGVAVACASPVTYRDLAVGPHTFEIVGADAAGNTTPESYAWTVTAASNPDPTPVTPTPTPTTPTTPPTTPTTPPGTPPTTVSVSPSSALRGSSAAVFSADVAGATASLASASGASVTVSLRCTSAAGAATSCAGGAVRSVTVVPAKPLVAGEQYTLTVKATDVNGRAVTGAKSFRASTDEQENTLGGVSTWKVAKASAAYGRRYVTEQRAGAGLSLAFRGSKVTWYTMTGKSQGVATVYVDGKKKATVNNYTAGTKWHVARTVKGLTNKAHTLRIVVAGRKGSKAGTGTGIVVDAVRVGTKLTANPAATTTWGVAKATSASAGAYAISKTAGATTSFTFRGKSITWVTGTAPTMGKAKVYVDGVLKATVDNYTKKTIWNVRRTIAGLADKTHTVKVVVLGTKRAAAKDTGVVVDRWLVG